MEFKQEGNIFTAADDEAVALVRSTHALLNECAKTLNIDVRMDETAITIGPGTLQLYVNVVVAAQTPIASISDVAEFVEQAKAGTIKRALTITLSRAMTPAAKPSWFKRNWKWLLGAAAGVAVITTGVVIYKRRSRKEA